MPDQEKKPEDVLEGLIWSGLGTGLTFVSQKIWKSKISVTQAYHVSEDFPHDWIKNKREQGYGLTHVAASNNEWIVFMTEGVNVRNLYYVGEEFPREWLEKNAKDRFAIADMDGKGSEWCIILKKMIAPGWRYLNPREEWSEARDAVSEVWNKSMTLTCLGGNDDGWSGSVMLKPSIFGFKEEWQQFTGGGNTRELFDWVKEKIDANYTINAIGGRRGEWVAFCRHTSNVYGHSYGYNSGGIDRDEIRDLLARGYFAYIIASDGYDWFYIFRKFQLV